MNRLTPGHVLRAGVLLSTAILLGPALLQAQETTRVMVRVMAHDARLIGSAAGGARVTVRDARTGSLLARGDQQGEGGNGFLAELQLERPTQIRIEAEGPLGNPDAIQRESRTMLVVPGQDVLGDGVVIDLYGFAVELIEPSTDLTKAGGQEITVRARVTMLCGCPTEPGGTWDSTDYTIESRIVHEGEVVQKVSLAYSGETSVYEAQMTVPDSVEGLILQVLAMDAAKANFGMIERPFEELGRGQSSD